MKELWGWWVGVGVAVAILAAVVWSLWWRLPKRQMRSITLGDPKARADIEDNVRKTVGQALGGIFVLMGAGLALAQFLEQRDTAQRQIKVSQDQVAISQQQVQATHDLLVSNQIAKGFEQLGSDKIEVRLGGIYALEGILHMPPPRSSPDYRQPVLEALGAFVREHTIGMTVQAHPMTDVQAVLKVTGRPERVAGGRVDLEGAIVPGAFLAGANLHDADLRDIHLEAADLSGADLSGADLKGSHLSGADLRGVGLKGSHLAPI